MDGNPHETQKGEVKKKKKEERREEEKKKKDVSVFLHTGGFFSLGRSFPKQGRACVYIKLHYSS